MQQGEHGIRCFGTPGLAGQHPWNHGGLQQEAPELGASESRALSRTRQGREALVTK